MANIKERVGLLVDRPAGARRIGARYYAIDVYQEYEWNGAEWLAIESFVPPIEEDISFGVAEMFSAAAVNTGSSMPRFTLPDAATTSVFAGGFNFPKWWHAVDIHFAHVNDHSAAGNLRIRTILREVDVGTESVSTGAVIHDVTETHAAAGANGGMTIRVPAASVPLTPGLFGSVYGFEFQRLGADGADTLAGPAALLAVGFTRKA